MKLLVLDTAVVFGGGQKELIHLIRGLRQRGISVRVLATGERRLVAALEEMDVPVDTWSVRSGAQRSSILRPTELQAVVRGVVELARAIRADPPDLIHANSERAGLVAALLPRPLRPPFVFHDRTLETRGGLVRWVGRRSSAVIAISRSVAAKHGADTGSDRIRLIPGGIDLTVFTPLPPRRERAPMVFAFVGRISAEKGPHIFLRAARAVIQSGREARFILCGQMPSDVRSSLSREIFAYLEAPELSGRAALAGFVEDIPRFLEQVDVAVMPSLREGLGISAIEALGRGRPVIASRVGGLAELVSHGVNGLLVDAGDVAGLAEAMEQMIVNSPLYVRLSEAAPPSISRFTVERMVESTADCLLGIVGRPS